MVGATSSLCPLGHAARSSVGPGWGTVGVEGGGDEEEEEPEEDAGQEGAARGDGGGGGHGGMVTHCTGVYCILSDSCTHASEPYENESAGSFVCGGMFWDGCEFDRETTSPACRCSSVVSVAPICAVSLGIRISWLNGGEWER